MTSLAHLPGLRERKAAALKLSLVDLLSRELTHRGFHEITVDELCALAMISKVTFFKYFPTKDALLWYHSSVWTYRLKADLLRSGKHGVPALRAFFKDTADHFNENQNLFGYFFSLNSAQMDGMERPELTRAEKLVLYPDGSTLDLNITLSIGEFLREQCQYARRNGDFRTDLTVEAQMTLFGALWHGSGKVGLRIDPSRPGDTYMTTFKALLKLLSP